MAKRTLTVRMQSDWRSALRATAKQATAKRYRGETLNFEDASVFFGRLSERRWALVRVLLGAGEIPLRELARRVERDVRRVHQDVTVLTDLGLVERSASGGVLCPFTDIHIDMHMTQQERACA